MSNENPRDHLIQVATALGCAFDLVTRAKQDVIPDLDWPKELAEEHWKLYEEIIKVHRKLADLRSAANDIVHKYKHCGCLLASTCDHGPAPF